MCLCPVTATSTQVMTHPFENFVVFAGFTALQDSCICDYTKLASAESNFKDGFRCAHRKAGCTGLQMFQFDLSRLLRLFSWGSKALHGCGGLPPQTHSGVVSQSRLLAVYLDLAHVWSDSESLY